MTCKNLLPLGYDPAADDLSIEEIEAALGRIRRMIRQTAEAMPTHEQYIFDHCRAA